MHVLIMMEHLNVSSDRYCRLKIPDVRIQLTMTSFVCYCEIMLQMVHAIC